MKRKWLNILAGIIGILGLALIVAMIMARPAEDHPWFREDDPDVLVIAHQGGEGLRPSNTMLAFENAVSLGADVLEMDVHLTSDGELVVIHDSTVDRTTDGIGVIKDMTLEEIKALDAGYYWTDDDGVTHPYRDSGVTIPTLLEVMESFPDMRLLVEIKPDDSVTAEALCTLIKRQGREETVMVASFHTDPMNTFRDACPTVATAAQTNEVITFFVLHTLRLGPTYSPSSYAFQVPEYRSGLHVLTPHFVKTAHRRGMEVHPWTINTIEDMELMVSLGVDGIITDWPDMLIDYLDR